MKTKDTTSYGVCGKRVEFNSLDCYAASHMLDRISSLKDALEKCQKDGIFPSPQEIEEIMDMFSNFLRKIALKPESMDNIFAPEEEEDEEKEC